jgi:hypothetical protein
VSKPPTSKDGPPDPVLRQWSDALAAAGLFAEALTVHPAAERVDVVRQAELAVLAGDHQGALALLTELAEATTARTKPSNPPPAKTKRPASPWLLLLTGVATLLAGDGDLAAVLAASKRVQPSAGSAWIVALAAAAVGDLKEAADQARAARAGGCRDLRMLVFLAARKASEADDRDALDLVAAAQRIALPDEDPAALTVELMGRSGFDDDARRLATAGAGDASLPATARADWRSSAQRLGSGRLRSIGRSLAVARKVSNRRRQRSERIAQEEALSDLTCRCYGSGGWIGPGRMYYISKHLDELLPAPIAGLQARLLLCRATNLTFLDLVDRQVTVPVAAEPVRRRPAENADPGADPEQQPTPGMGFSLGMALPA